MKNNNYAKKLQEDIRQFRFGSSNDISHFAGSGRENIYIDGRGFANPGREDTTEKAALKTMKAVSTAVLIYIFADCVLSYMLAKFIGLFGVNITVDPISGNAVLRDFKSCIFMMTVTMLKFIFPVIFYHFSLRSAPLYLYLKKPKASGGNILSSFGLVFAVSGLLAAAVFLFPGNLYADYISSNVFSNNFFLKNNSLTECTIFIIFWTAAVSVLTEIFLHTSSFHEMRKSGDYAAVICSALIPAFLSGNIFIALSSFLITFLTGISVIKTNSALTGIIQRFIIYMMFSVCSLIENLTGEGSAAGIKIIFSLSVFMLGLITLIISGFFKNIKGFFRSEKKNAIGFREYVIIISENPFIVTTVFLCAVLFIIRCIIEKDV